jgi:hypothetical protein
LVLFLPLPYAVEPKFEESALALKMGSSVPFVYENSEQLHPSERSFMMKMESSLTNALGRAEKSRSKKGRSVSAVDRARVDDFLDRLDRYFNSGG